MVFWFRWLARWPLPALHALGAILGWCVFAASPTYRRRFMDHVRLAGLQTHQWWGAVAEAGKLVLELPRLWVGAPVPVLWCGREWVAHALARRRGVVFLTPHLGCFEVTAQAYAAEFGVHGAPMTVLYRPPRQAWLRRWVEASRQRPGLQTAPTNLGGVKQLIKALRSGGSVGLLPDQVPPQGLGVMAPFFGRQAHTMTLAARLVQQTGATVLLAWGERLPGGRGYRVHVEPWLQPMPSDPVAAATAINAAMQRLVLRRPDQYLWGYARYKVPRADLG